MRQTKTSGAASQRSNRFPSQLARVSVVWPPRQVAGSSKRFRSAVTAGYLLRDVGQIRKFTDLRTITGLITWLTWDMLMVSGGWPYMALEIVHVDRWFKCLWPHARRSGSKSYLWMKTQQIKSLEGILYNQSQSYFSVCVITCAQQWSLKKYVKLSLMIWMVSEGQQSDWIYSNLKTEAHSDK